jgi:hypothetical protein
MILPSCDFGKRGEGESPRLADWGFKVTICIGALCENRDKIVLISDSKVSFGDFSADMAVFKMETLFPGWMTLFAGDDTEHIPFILERTQELLYKASRRKKASPSPAQAANALQRAYQERLDAQIEAKVLRRYGFTVKTFCNDGKKKCTATMYNGICNKIAGVKISLTFLVAGFDAKKKGRLIVGGGEDAPTDYTQLGYWAIGTGANSALSSLTFHRERQHISTGASVEECVYVVCASKFLSESATDVGRATTGCIISTHGLEMLLSEHPVRQLWEAEGAPRLPKNIESHIKPLIVSPEVGEKLAQAAVDAFKRSESQTSEGQK